MTASGDTSRRRPTFAAVAGAFWLFLGTSHLGDGRTWLGLTGMALGAVSLVSWWWPDSAFARFMWAPVFRRRKKTEELSAPGRG